MYELQIKVDSDCWKTIAKKYNGDAGRDELIRRGIEEMDHESWQVVQVYRGHSAPEKFRY